MSLCPSFCHLSYTKGTASQYKGNFSNHVVVVEFDTVHIHSIEFTDTEDNHVGIDINSLMSEKSGVTDLSQRTLYFQKDISNELKTDRSMC